MQKLSCLQALFFPCACNYPLECVIVISYFEFENIICYLSQDTFNLIQVCEQIILKLVGWKLVDVQVLDIKPWVMHAEVAEKYVSHNNRVILVGDAAHRFPPAGGFGKYF